jgi:hypothetical protein
MPRRANVFGSFFKKEQNRLSVDVFWGQPQTPWFRFAEGVEKRCHAGLMFLVLFLKRTTLTNECSLTSQR